MGNPHAVQVVADIERAPGRRQGPRLEHHPRFPQRVNAGYMQVVDRATIRLRVWERGAGETLACGTGACAAVVAGVRRGLLDSPVRVETRGGWLTIAWSGPGTPVTMTGPATTRIRRRVGSPGGVTRELQQDIHDKTGLIRMDANAVALYLKENPKFFEEFADVIADIFVPHPHGGHAIPIAERQIVTLREKNTELENRLARNDPLRRRERPDQRAPAPLDARADRGARPRDDARRALPQPAGGLRRAARDLPALGQGAGAVVPARARGDEPGASRLRRSSSARRTAVRRRRSSRATGSMPATPASRSRSCRCAPRTRSACWRCGDENAERFHSGMGTVYLTRLAELASVATSRYLPPA